MRIATHLLCKTNAQNIQNEDSTDKFNQAKVFDMNCLCLRTCFCHCLSKCKFAVFLLFLVPLLTY